MKTLLFSATAVAAIVTAMPAQAAHVIVRDFNARTDATATSAAQQGPNYAISTAHYLNGAPVAGDNRAANGGSSTGGGSTARTYAATTQDGAAGNTALSLASSASADLTAGLLKATVDTLRPMGGIYNMGGSANARLDDTIFFTNTSGSTQTVSFTYRFDGQIYLNGADPRGIIGGSAGLSLSCGLNQYACDNGSGQSITFADRTGNAISLYGGPRSPEDSWIYYFNPAGTSCFGENIYCGQYSSGLWTYGLNAPDANGVVDAYITAYLNIPTGLTSLGVRGTLNLDCRGGTSCDFGHTGAFSFGALPTGVSYGSGSGVFLTANAVAAGVPEPATWLSLILGFGAIGIGLRRRSSTLGPYAA